MSFSPIKTVRLSELAGIIQQTLDYTFLNNTFWIIADVTSHTFRNTKNYHHFELVEKDKTSTAVVARMQARAWGAGAESIGQFEEVTGQLFTNNIQVLVNVSVTFHEVFGLQLNVNEVDANFTIGLLELQRRSTLARLLENYPDAIRKAGDRYITRNQGLAISRVIQRIAVISSSTSAGWRDFHAALRENEFGFRFDIDDYFTAVQGEANAALFVDTLVQIFQTGITYDAVVIIRGGGAQADFQLFDEYVMGRVIAKYPIPVITGIGHQKNETITDLMAHTQTRTPTQAAEFIIRHNHSFEAGLLDLQHNIVVRSQQLFSFHSRVLMQLNAQIVNSSRSVLFHHRSALTRAGALFSSRPRILLAAEAGRLAYLLSNIISFTRSFVSGKAAILGHHQSLVNLMSPARLLKKGFALVSVDNKVISGPDQLCEGREFKLFFEKAVITATVIDKKQSDGESAEL